MEEPLLCADHVSISYNGKEVVKDVSFTLEEGKILGIVGESGSGKSTLIKAVMGILGSNGMVTRGDILYKGKNLTDMAQRELRRLCGKEIAMVFQDCKSSLCPIRTIGDQIYESMTEHKKISRKETERQAGEIMSKIGLHDCERILKSYPFELSGGMNQRVGICMAMMHRPAVLLADEPTSALDVTVQKQVAEELKLMREEYNTAIILVTHNIGLVRVMADQILVLKDGKTIEYGSRERVLNHPEEEYTKQLMASVPHLRRSAEKKKR